MPSNMSASNRYFSCKGTYALLVAMAFLSSCATQRRCIEKFPPTTTIVTKDSTIYRDTTVYVPLPADTVIVDSLIVLPCPPPVGYSTRPVTAQNRYSTARAWLEGSRLRLQLTVNDTVLAIMIDSAVTVRLAETTITQGHVVKEKYVPMAYRVGLWISICVAVLALIKIVLSSLK